LLSIFIGVYAAVISSIYFLLPLHLQGNLKFSGAQIGLLYAVFNLNAILVAFPVGVSGDRYAARGITRLGLAGCALCLWGMATLRSFRPFFLIFWGFGLSAALLSQSLNIMLFKGNGAEGSTARRFGHFNAMRMGGMMLGTLAGGFLVHLLNFPRVLQLCGGVLLLMWWPSAWLPVVPAVRASMWEYRRELFTRPVLFFVTWLFLFTLHWGAEATSLTLFLQHNLGLEAQGIGAYMAGEFAVITVTAYLYGRFWAGRLQPLTFLAVALLASGSGHILMTWPILPWSFAWRAVHGFGDGLILMETYATVSRQFHVDRIGGTSSLIPLITTMGVLVGSLIFGPLGAAMGYQAPLIISGIITLALLPVAYRGLQE